MKPITVFASQFGAKIALKSDFVVEKAQRYYLVNPRLKQIAQNEYYYAGLYLGKVKNSVFFPSFNLLRMLTDVAANKVVVDKKTAWLFICGRDVFQQGIVKVQGSRRRGDATLILNEYNECLGFGRISGGLNEDESKVAVKNILDVGDFLRREF